MSSPPPRRAPTSRAARRRPRSAAYRRRRFAALALVAAAPLVVGLLVGRGGGGKSLSPADVVRIQRAEQPGHFTESVSRVLLIHSPLWDRALELGGGSHYDFAPELA